MRNLLRNQQLVYFRRIERHDEIKDQYGNATGNFTPVFGPLETEKLCVSPNKGNYEVFQFGAMQDYDRTMTTSDTSCRINEGSVLWLDGADPEKPHNYIVKKCAPWKNSIAYAIKHVSVSAYAEN